MVAALVLAACGTADEGAEPSPPTSPPATSPGATATETGGGQASPPTPGSAGTAASGPAAQVPGIAARCTLAVATGRPERIRLAYPEGWLVQEGCRWFDPEAESVREDTEPSVAVSWRVSGVSFGRASSGLGGELADAVRYVGARSGYQALRVQGEASGQGLREEGQPVVMWLVDLDPGTDEQGGTLIGTAHPGGGASFDAAAYALDRMADTLLLEPPASQRLVVTRLEGGGRPVTVTRGGGEGCFRLRAGGPGGEVVDEACGPGLPGSSGLSPVLLEGAGRRMLAGIAAPRIERITVSTAGTPSGATTQSVEGGNLFALPVGAPPFEVVGHDYAGQTIASVTFDG